MSIDTKKIPIYICPDDIHDVYDSGWTWEYVAEHLPSGISPVFEPLKCTCGCWSVYGKECPIEFHSFWCDLIRRN